MDNNNGESILLNILGKFKNSTKLEEKLIDLNYPLEEFLKDDEAIECYKNMEENTKKYFRPEIVKQLIKYITVEPENDDYLEGHKYPYIACEILKIDCPYIQDLFVLTEKEYNLKYNNKNNNNENNEKKEEKKENNNNINQQKENIENIIDITEKGINNNKDKNEEKDIQNNIKENINESKKDFLFNYEEEIIKNETKEINNNKELKENNDNKINKIIEENVGFKKENEIIFEKEKDVLKGESKEEKNIIINTIKETSQNNEYLDLLLNFITNKKKKLNYILCGYFSEVLMTLIETYSFELLIYLYVVRKDALLQIIRHSYHKSLSEISSKLLKLNNYMINDIKELPANINKQELGFIYFNLHYYREELFKKIIFSISLDGMKDEEGNIYDDYEIENIFSILYDLMDEKIILNNLIFDYKIYNYIFEKLEANIFIKKESNNNIINKKRQYIYLLFIKLLIKILKNINNEKQGFFFVNDLDVVEILEGNNFSFFFYGKIILSIKNIIGNFIDLSSIEPNSPNKLGIHIIYILDLMIEIFKYMKDAPITIDVIFIKTDFMIKCIDYFFKYQLNNIYHFKFIEFFKLYLDNISLHEKLTYQIFYDLKFDEILEYYVNENNEENIIEDNNNKDKFVEIRNRLKSYKNKNLFSSKKNKKCPVYPYVIELMYLLQAKSGLKTFDAKEIKKLNIKKLGEFEFLKEENSKEDNIKIKISEFLKNKLNESATWKNTFKIIFPIIKKYEKKLLYDRIKTKESNKTNKTKKKNKETNKNKNKKKNKNKDSKKVKTSLKQYNDVNFWEVKIKINSEIKNKLDKNKANKVEDKNNSNEEIIDEEDELLGIALQLEKKEKSQKIKKSSKKSKKSKTNSTKNTKNKSKTKKSKVSTPENKNENEPNPENKSEKNISNENKEENISKKKVNLNSKKISLAKKINKEKVLANFKKPSKDKINKMKINIKKEDKTNEYNDVNFWSVKPEGILNENIINDIIEDL